MLNRIGAKTYPCFTSTFTGKYSEHSPLDITLSSVSWLNCFIICTNVGGQPLLARIVKSMSLLIVSNALMRSMKAVLKCCLCSMDFSMSWWHINIMSTVVGSALKPHWESGRIWSFRWARSLTKSTFPRILPATSKSCPPTVPTYEFIPYPFKNGDHIALSPAWRNVSTCTASREEVM